MGVKDKQMSGVFYAIVQSFDASVIVTDLKRKIVYLNHDAEKHFGHSRKEATGSLLSDVIGLDPEAGDDLWTGMESVEQAKGDVWYEALHMLRYGHAETVRIKARIVPASRWESVAVFVIKPHEDWPRSYADIAAGSPVVFFETSSDGTFLYGSNQFASILSVDEASVEGSCIRDFVLSEQVAGFDDMWKHAMGGQAVRDRDLCLVDAQDRPHHFWVSLFPLKDGEGTTVGVRGIAGDLAEQKGLAYALEAAEERFSVLFRESSDPILILSMDGDILSANPSFELLSCVPSRELFSGEKTWADFVVRDDLARLLESVRRCVDKEEEQVIEFRMKGKGDPSWFELSCSILHDEKGSPRGIMAVARDVTQHKQRELELQEEAQTIRLRHRRAQELISLLTQFLTKINDLPNDLDSFLAGVCDLLASMYHPTYAMIIIPGKNRMVLQADVERPEVLVKDEAVVPTSMCSWVMESGSPLYCNTLHEVIPYTEDSVVKALGFETYLGAPLRASSGEILGTLALLDTETRDFDHLDVELVTVGALQIASRLQSAGHEEVERALEDHLRQSQKMEAVGMLAGGIAHDFNNILSGILGFASFLLMKVDTETDMHRYLTLIEQSATQAAELTKQLLTFSRRSNFAKEAIPINEVVRDTTAIIRPSIPNLVNLIIDYADDLPSVLGDRTQLSQVVMNLCLNAADAMREKGGELRVTTQNRSLTEREQAILKEMNDEEYVCISVVDTGEGMDPDVQEHIFEPFFTTKSRKGGTGLGLSIVYGTVKNHGGDISVESEKGLGTAFTVYLPVHEGERQLRKEERAVSGGGGTETVLIVDDEEIVRQMVSEILRASGYTTLLACSGEEGVETLEAQKDEIDLVMLDMVMPGMGGEETYHAMQKIVPGVGVLLTTGFSQGELCADLLHHGARGLVRKPYKSRELLRFVRQALSFSAGQ